MLQISQRLMLMPVVWKKSSRSTHISLEQPGHAGSTETLLGHILAYKASCPLLIVLRVELPKAGKQGRRLPVTSQDRSSTTTMGIELGQRNCAMRTSTPACLAWFLCWGSLHCELRPLIFVSGRSI